MQKHFLLTFWLFALCIACVLHTMDTQPPTIEPHAKESILLSRMLHSGAEDDYVEFHEPLIRHALAGTMLGTLPEEVHSSRRFIPIWRALVPAITSENPPPQEHSVWHDLAEQVRLELAWRHLMLARGQWYARVANNVPHVGEMLAHALIFSARSSHTAPEPQHAADNETEKLATAAIHAAYGYLLCAHEETTNAFPHLVRALELCPESRPVCDLIAAVIAPSSK